LSEKENGILVSKDCREMSRVLWLQSLLRHAVDDHCVCSDIGSGHVFKLHVLSQEMPSHVDVVCGWFVGRV